MSDNDQSSSKRVHESESEYSDSKEVKKSKPQKEDANKYQVNDQGEKFFTLGKPHQKKRLTIRKWKNSTLIDIREFYEDSNSGELRPGKKGISLSEDQWNSICDIVNDVNGLIKKQNKSDSEEEEEEED